MERGKRPSEMSFSWLESSTKTVQAGPECWDSLLQSNPAYAYVPEKPFPSYETWVEMYAKDGATGNKAFDFQGAANAGPSVHLNDEVEIESTIGWPSNLFADHLGASESGTPLSNQPGNTEKVKRKRTELSEELVEVISGLWTNARGNQR